MDLTKPIDEIWKGMDLNNTRRAIRFAEKLGSRVRLERNGESADVCFLELYNSFATAKGDIACLNGRVLSRYKGNSDTFIAWLDDRPLCAHIALLDYDLARTRLLYSASRRFDNRETARACAVLNRLLIWHEIQLYRQEGLRVYDFGGIRADMSDGITRFKMSFGPEVVRENNYLCAGTRWFGQVVQRIFENLSSRGRRWRPFIAGPETTAQDWTGWNRSESN
jgi:hypothetical protein